MVRCTPRQRHLVTKCDTTAPLGQVDLWSDVPPGRDILWPNVIVLHLWVRLTCGQMSLHRQRHLVTKCDTTSGQVELCIGG